MLASGVFNSTMLIVEIVEFNEPDEQENSTMRLWSKATQRKGTARVHPPIEQG